MRNAIISGLLILFGVIIGIVNAWAWFFELIPFVREMIPFAFAFAVIIVIITAFLRAKCGNTQGSEECHMSSTCKSVRGYSLLLLIVAAIFIVFSIIVLATYLPFIARFVLAFIGSISFWIMFLTFFAMISRIFLKR